jgi:hypothetical protein
MRNALGWLLLGLLVLVILVYALRKYVLPILGLPEDVSGFIMFIVGVGGLCAVLLQTWRSWPATPAA